MVGFAFGNSGKYINEEYRQTRIEALKQTVDIREWGEIDIEKYDLDKLPSTLGGPMYERGYTFERTIQGSVEDGSFDIRDLPTHD